MQRVDQLTFTRFIAVFLVLIYHNTAWIVTQVLGFFPFSALIYAAPTAVSYLYVLSGFVLSLVYYRPHERFNVRGFWSARFVRIYPMYILAFLIICLYYIEFMAHIKAPKILANLFLIQSWYPDYAQSFNYPAWSLCVEFFFYAVFPFLTIWAYQKSTRLLAWLSMGLWVVSQTVYYLLWMRYFPDWEYFLVYFPLFHLNSFVLGVVAGIWFLREGQNYKSQKTTNALLLVGSTLFVVLFTIGGELYPSIPHGLQPMAGFLSPFFAVIVLTLSLDTSWFSRILNHPWLVLLGETAFILYVFEVPFVWNYTRLLENTSPSDAELILRTTALPIILLIGVLGHLYVDIPIRRWLTKLMKRISMPVLLLDLAAVAISIWLSFMIRFGTGRDAREYLSAAYYTFWVAFIVRIVLNIATNSTNPQVILGPIRVMVQRTLLAIGLGSLFITGLMWIEFRFGWIPGWPRSVFVLDGLIMLGLSLGIRYFIRNTNLYRRQRTSAVDC
jgi:peptidoglycan/LPS O-acetylase OafA/YrhL